MALSRVLKLSMLALAATMLLATTMGQVPAGTVTIALKGEPNTLDPHRVIGRQSEAFMPNVYDGLTARDQDGELVPALATSWRQISPTVWRFTLRRGVTFHNGEVFNAQSVKFTLDRALNPQQRATTWSQLVTISEVRIVDDFTVDVVTSRPDILLPARLSELFGAMLPPRYTEQLGEAIGTRPIGTGPFRVIEWVKNERMVLEANTTYWRGAPAIQRVLIRPIAEDSARVAALLAGEVDMMEGVPFPLIDVLQRFPQTKVERATAARIFYIALNSNVAPLNDIRVRQALNYAIDRETIIKQLYLGFGRPAASIVAAQAPAFDAAVTPYPYDPERAKRLLAEAGYPAGFEIEFDYFTGSIADHYTPSQAVAGYLRNIGIRLRENVYEIGVFQEKRGADRAAPLYVYSLGDVFLEPVWLIEWLAAGDMSRRYNNPEVNRLVEQITRTFEPAVRKPLYSRAQQLMKEDAQHIFLFQVDTVWGLRQHVQYTLRADEIPWFYPLSVRR
jgi:peptide/nickel transport system substrate-binding protein